MQAEFVQAQGEEDRHEVEELSESSDELEDKAVHMLRGWWGEEDEEEAAARLAAGGSQRGRQRNLDSGSMKATTRLGVNSSRRAACTPRSTSNDGTVSQEQ